MKKINIILPFILTVIILVIIYFTFYKDTQLLSGLNTTYDSNEILRKAESLVQDLNTPISDLRKSYGLQSNQGLINQVQNQYGFKKGNELLRNYLPGFFWRIKWDKVTRANISFGFSEGEDMSNNTKVRINYDSHGNLIEYYVVVNDSAEIPTLNPGEARAAAKKFISHFFKLDYKGQSKNIADTAQPVKYSLISKRNEVLNFNGEKKIILSHRTDYVFMWSGKSAYIDDSIKVDVTVSGNLISGYTFSYVVPDKYTTLDSDLYQGIFAAIFYFAIIILIGITAYKKIKAYEIGFKLAFILTAAVVLSFGIHLYVIIGHQMSWVMVFPLVFGPVFYGGLVFVTWASGETMTREIWKEKFSPLDLIAKGFYLNTRIGESIVTGLTAGFTIIIIQMLFLFIAQNFTAVFCTSYYSVLLSSLNSLSPATSIITSSIFYPIFLTAVFLLFLVSGLRKRIKSPVLLILVSGIIWGLVNSNEVYPNYINIILDIITGIVIVWIYYKFDVLSSIIALANLFLITQGMALLNVGNASYVSSGYLLISVIILIVFYGFGALLSGNSLVDIDAITPAFVKNVTERERLQRELEIAKEVQMSFLPRTDPVFPGLEIASRCVPALEVGGDYYDFVITGDKKIGIIIGDVSGKGTQAAFYMTLTKGFLKALSRIAYPPANFLTELNSLFYENVDRGTFISMVYGVLDTENKSFTLARAGHNPVIVKNSFQGNTEFLNSSGLALGLEKGDIFAKTIKEVEIPIASGDVFVFYTDGFTEAMNKINEEFGEKRLVSSVENNSGLPARQILDNIFNEVHRFIGKAEQHDDMTMVVVKVL